MTLRSRWVWVALLWLSFPILRAQVTFSLPVVNNATPGAVVTMPVEVLNFDSIIGVQFVIQWDPEVINYLTVLNFNLPGMTIENFGRNQTDEGILRFAWNTPLVKTGLSLPDSSFLFLIKFSAKGQHGDGTPVVFTEIPPTFFEVVKADTTQPPLRMEDCRLNHGYVAIGFNTSTHDGAASSSVRDVQISPNPFAERTVVTFELSSDEVVRLLLSDATGRMVEEWRHDLPAGRHGIEIAPLRCGRGLHFLWVRTERQVSVQPLIRL